MRALCQPFERCFFAFCTGVPVISYLILSRNDTFMHTVISWLAYNNDFVKMEAGGLEVSPAGPTAGLHAHFWKYDRHVLLSQNSEGQGDPRLIALYRYLQQAHPDHSVEMRYVGLRDIINVREIKEKSERLLAEYQDDDVEVFISPGTPAMQVAWYLSAMSQPGIRLFQTRRGDETKQRPPERVDVEVERSKDVASLVVREENAAGRARRSSALFRSKALEEVYPRAERVAQNDRVTALILGESGTGKERLARFVHESSTRRNQSFVAINCAAFRSEALLESRLFGYQKGAFTGADKNTPGLFDEADGGTLFLDEIGDVSAGFQATLLRVLQEREFTPVGSTKPKKVDVRVIAATHRDLPARCAAGDFRWDLYYRLAVAELTLPPLRHWNKDDVQRLIGYFVDQHAARFNRRRIRPTRAAEQALLAYAWPGNIREMEHLIESLYVFHDDAVDARDLPERLTAPLPGQSLRLEDAERAHILAVHARFGGNNTRTAEALGIALNTLKKRLREYAER